MACHYGPFTACTVERGQPSSPFESTQRWTIWGVACNHSLCISHTIRLHKELHAIITIQLHTQMYDVGPGIPSWPWERTNSQTTSGVACPHCPWNSQTVGRRRVCNARVALQQHTWSNNVGPGMQSSHLDSTHSRTLSRVACHHSPWRTHMVR